MKQSEKVSQNVESGELRKLNFKETLERLLKGCSE